MSVKMPSYKDIVDGAMEKFDPPSETEEQESEPEGKPEGESEED